jgi:acyl dehydratase
MLFIAPVGTGARVRAHASLVSAELQDGRHMLLKLRCTLGIDGDPKLALVAEVVCMLIGKPDAT